MECSEVGGKLLGPRRGVARTEDDAVDVGRAVRVLRGEVAGMAGAAVGRGRSGIAQRRTYLSVARGVPAGGEVVHPWYVIGGAHPEVPVVPALDEGFAIIGYVEG